MKLKVSGVECIYGCYVHSAILPTFHRRSYWLLQVRYVCSFLEYLSRDASLAYLFFFLFDAMMLKYIKNFVKKKETGSPRSSQPRL